MTNLPSKQEVARIWDGMTGYDSLRMLHFGLGVPEGRAEFYSTQFYQALPKRLQKRVYKLMRAQSDIHEAERQGYRVT